MPVLWIDDVNGEIGTVNSTNGAVTLIGNSGVVLTDIAFNPQGQLFGITFTSLYSINTSTGAASLIGNLGGGAGGMNGLVCDSDGTFYAVSAATNELYRVDTATGNATAVSAALPAASAGDLAFEGAFLYMADSNGNLDRISISGDTASVVGPIGFSNVSGLATGPNGILYGVSGTQLILIDTATGAGTVALDYGGQGLNIAFGLTTYTLNVAAPSSNSDLYITTAGTPLTVSVASGVLANDTDPNGLSLSASLDQSTSHGTLVFNQNGSFTYTPQAGFVGTDSFTYTASDAALSSTVTTASIVVGSLNALTSPSQVLTELYVGYFDRAPDVSGLNYWLTNYNTPPAQSPGGVNLFYQNLGQAAASFADPHQTETVTLYPFLANPQAASYSAVVTFLNAAYGNLFNRTPDTLGEEYWATSIAKSLGIPVPVFGNPTIDNDGPVAASQALLALILGAQANDAQTIANKVTAGLYYYDLLSANNVTATQVSAHAALSIVTSDPATVLASEATTNAFVLSAVHSSGASVSLVGQAGTSVLDHAVGSV
jgi:hypothetical protein